MRHLRTKLKQQTCRVFDLNGPGFIDSLGFRPSQSARLLPILYIRRMFVGRELYDQGKISDRTF